MALTDNTLEVLAIRAGYDAREMAKLCNLSLRQLQREFKHRFSLAPQDWLNKHRIRAAQQLLLSGIQVKTVALELGFKQPSHFSRHFKIYSRMTPSQFAAVRNSPWSGVVDR